MGEQLEIQWLAETPYLVMSNESTNWEPKTKEITPEQYRQIEILESKQYTERKTLLSTFK